MKLYYKPGACSLASHIVLRELDVPFDLEKVDLATKKTASGADYWKINPKGYVPALEIDGGLLTENAAVLQYIADLKPQSALAPPRDSMDRYRLQEWLAYVNSEVHKSYGPFFTPDAGDAEKGRAADKLSKRIEFVEKSLGDKPFLMGDKFTVADAYLYVVLGWAAKAGLDIGNWPKVAAYHKRIGERPAVQAAQKAEQA